MAHRASPNALKDDLIRSLTRFLALRERSSCLLDATQAEISNLLLDKECRDYNNEQVCLGLAMAFSGGLFGAAFGALTGSILGGLSAHSAATIARLFCKNKTFDLTGGVVGGMVGGVSCGSSGAALGASYRVLDGEITGSYNVVCGAFGCAVGMVTGAIYGGAVGAVGGAIGGGLTAFGATKIWMAVVESCSEKKGSKRGKIKALVRASKKFKKSFNEMAEELTRLKEISEELNAGWIVRGLVEITDQVQEDVRGIEGLLKLAQNADYLGGLIVGVRIAGRDSLKVKVGMEALRIEAEKRLYSLKKN